METTNLSTAIAAAVAAAVTPLRAEFERLSASGTNTAKAHENAPQDNVTEEERQAEENARCLKGVRRRLQTSGIMPTDEMIKANNLKYNIR